MAYTPPKELSLEEEQVVVEEAQKDRAKFQTLYEIYFPKIYHYCYFRVFDQVAAEDLCSQVFLKALEAFPKFEWRGVSFAAWLYRIANNEVSNHYRKNKNKPVPLDDVNPARASVEGDFLENLSEVEEIILVKECVRLLGADCQDMLTLRFFKELPYKKVAEFAGKTEAACKMKVKRCLEELKDKVSARIKTGGVV
jgi:RNA polymerase sigma-70 factor (ECF subfamily)